MIPKASIDALAQADGLLPTTVDKDYVLGWLLYGIADHPFLSQWVVQRRDMPQEVLLRDLPLLGRPRLHGSTRTRADR